MSIVILTKKDLENFNLAKTMNYNEKDEIIAVLQNSLIIHWNHINFYGEYDFTRSYKRIHRLIALNGTKGFINVMA